MGSGEGLGSQSEEGLGCCEVLRSVQRLQQRGIENADRSSLHVYAHQMESRARAASFSPTERAGSRCEVEFQARLCACRW